MIQYVTSAAGLSECRKITRTISSSFPQAVEVAKLYTEEQSETVAVDKFKEILRNSDMWFNSEPFPSSESDEDAFVKCRDAESAEEYCPERWKAMQKWIKNAIDVSYEPYKHSYCLYLEVGYLYSVIYSSGNIFTLTLQG